MNFPCRECEELKSFYEENNCNYTAISFVVNWSFSNIDLGMEETHPPYDNAEEKNKYNNDSVKSFKRTGKLNLSVWIY